MMILLIFFACQTKTIDTSVPMVKEDRFSFPLAEEDHFYMVVGVDHDAGESSDPLGAECIDYQGREFPHCYDGHKGSDYLLVDGFHAMDAGSSEIIAAADGLVTDVVDGNYDRCHLDFSIRGVDCDGHPMRANKVTILHENGLQAIYAHMKTDSIIVSIGQQILRGDVLGLVGSSGYSSVPHLHFEVSLPDETIVDPYSGSHSQPDSLWCDQQDPFPGDCVD
jgi:hypothetical protein